MILVALLSVAHADDPRLAVPAAGRGMTLGRHNVMLGAEGGLWTVAGANAAQFVLPLRVGVVEDLEIFASPVVQTSGPLLHEPALGVVYRFLGSGPIEVGATAYGDLALFQQDPAATAVLGVPVRVRLGDLLAVDTGVLGLLSVVPATYGGFQVPLGATLSLTDSLFLGANAAVKVADLGDAADSLGVPITTTIGYTIPRDDVPLLDVGARVQWLDIQAADALSALVFGRIYLFP